MIFFYNFQRSWQVATLPRILKQSPEQSLAVSAPAGGEPGFVFFNIASFLRRLLQHNRLMTQYFRNDKGHITIYESKRQFFQLWYKADSAWLPGDTH